MSRWLSFDATLSLKDGIDIDELKLDEDEFQHLFSEWGIHDLDRTIQINGSPSVNDIPAYLKAVQDVLSNIAEYVCDGEDGYVIDLDAVWPAGWRFVFKDGKVKCYEGMMVFLDEVKL